MNFQKNEIIDYYDSRRISCGLVLDVEDKRLRVLSDQGKEAKVSTGRVLTTGRDPEFPFSGSRDKQVDRLREISDQRDEIKKTIDLKELWEVVGPETGKIDLEDLTELLFGRNQSADKEASLLRAIFEDRLYFRIRPDGIEVPLPERVEQALLQRRREMERGEFIARSAQYLAGLKNSREAPADSPPEDLISKLEEAALKGTDWITAKAVKEIFSQAGLTPEWNPFRVLVKLGVWSKDENVRLRAEGVPVAFSAETADHAARAAQKSLSTGLTDLSDAESITIDATTTRDVDDALSLTKDGEDTVIGIHITDAAHFVEHETPLDHEVRERAVSIYLPDLIIPMIPPVLSEDAASLAVGRPRQALSVLARFGPDLKLKDYRIESTKILVRERLSYEQADGRIADKEYPEAVMFAIAEDLRRTRSASGALIFKDPEISVRVAEDGCIEVNKRDRETPSQILVSELMILANSLFATFMRERGIPGIYRSQPPPVEKIELDETYDPVQSYRSKRLLARGDLGTMPSPHSTLGLEAYTTATSPLRRYPDLVVQRQIKAALEGNCPPLDRTEVEGILTEVSFKLERAALLERERQRYFLLKYFEERKNQEFESIVLHRFPKFHLVQLTEYGVNAALNSTGGMALKPYDRAIVRIEKINPRDDRLTLSLVKLL
ncbi:MAG: ribonuclease catalytic domain-containing protein [Desulfomonilaceae bacterium]|nr:ribonuclease catalytic domain-containing protein [Desulfomonilaceae bacterium]